VHVARYYFRRAAYVAAANRAQQAVQEFQQSPAAEEALAIMVFSYERLGMADLSDAAKRVQLKNFPKTKFVTAASLGQQDKRWWQVW
jgi:outer membrane protein assembly factor BamD